MLDVRLGKFGFNVPSQVLYVGQTGLPVWVNRFESTALPRFVLFCFVSFRFCTWLLSFFLLLLLEWF